MTPSPIFANAQDSLEVGLRHYLDGDPILKQKHAILLVSHSVELFLKEKLRSIHPILIYRCLEKKTDDDAQAVGLKEILARFEDLGVALSTSQQNILRDLQRRRNRIEHHRFDPDATYDLVAGKGRATNVAGKCYELALRSLGALCLLCLVLLPSASPATTWQVTWSPDQPTDQIGAVVTQAGEGDTILVGPGMYFEHIDLLDKALVLVSTNGAASTTFSGAQAIPGRYGSVIYTTVLRTQPFALRGFTLRDGSGAPFYEMGWAGGGVAIGGGSVEIADCVFEYNSVLIGGVRIGGALAIAGADASITDCTFRHNGADARGGHIFVTIGHYSFTKCVLELTDDGWEEGLGVYAGFATAMLRLDNCELRGISNTRRLDSIVSYAFANELTRNRFIDDGVPVATSVWLSSLGSAEVVYTARLEGNLFQGSLGLDDNPNLRINYLDSQVVLQGNTFLTTRMMVAEGGSSWLSFARNILGESSARLNGGVGEVLCNDVWPDSSAMDIHETGMLIERNISRDPMFCAPESGDYRISAQSPCAPGLSPAGCDLVGAFGVGCGAQIPTGSCCFANGSCLALEPNACADQSGVYMGDGTSCESNPCQPTPTRQTTWGNLKALYR